MLTRTLFKVAGFLPIFFSLNAFAQENVLKLRLQGPAYADETIIRFVDGATGSFDGEYDAWKLFSLNPQVPSVYTEIDSLSPLSINSLPALTQKTSVDIYIKANAAGSFTITPSMVSSFTPGTCILLEDIYSGQMYSVLDGKPVTFYLRGAAPSGIKLFRAHFSMPLEVAAKAASCFNAADGEMHLTKKGFASWDYSVYTTSGINVLTGTATSDDHDLSGMEKGTYYVTTVSPYGCPDTVLKEVEGPAAIKPSFYSPDSVSLSMAVVQFDNITQESGGYLWDFGDGSPYSTEASPMHYYSAPGTYIVTLTAFSGSCSESSTRTLTVLDDQITTGIKEGPATNPVKVFASGQVIAMEGLAGEPVQVAVFSALGQQVASSLVQPGEMRTTARLRPGCYFVSMSTAKVQRLEKLVIKGE